MAIQNGLKYNTNLADKERTNLQSGTCGKWPLRCQRMRVGSES